MAEIFPRCCSFSYVKYLLRFMLGNEPVVVSATMNCHLKYLKVVIYCGYRYMLFI